MVVLNSITDISRGTTDCLNSLGVFYSIHQAMVVLNSVTDISKGTTGCLLLMGLFYSIH
jgi:hypothetical protein